MTPHSNERAIAGIERCFGKAIQGPLEMLESHHPPLHPISLSYVTNSATHSLHLQPSQMLIFQELQRFYCNKKAPDFRFSLKIRDFFLFHVKLTFFTQNNQFTPTRQLLINFI